MGFRENGRFRFWPQSGASDQILAWASRPQARFWPGVPGRNLEAGNRNPDSGLRPGPES